MEKKPQTPADTELLRDLEQLLAAQAKSSPSQQPPVVDIGIALARAQMVKALNARIEVLEDELRPYKHTERLMANEIQDKEGDIAAMREELENMKQAKKIIIGNLTGIHWVRGVFSQVRQAEHSHEVYCFEWVSSRTGRNVAKRTTMGISTCKYVHNPLDPNQACEGCLIQNRELDRFRFHTPSFGLDLASKYMGYAEKDLHAQQQSLCDEIHAALERITSLNGKAFNNADGIRMCEKELAEKRRQLNELLGLPPSQGK